MKNLFTLLACVASLVAFSSQADEPWPNRPVKIIVPYTPGTGIDILARTLGQKLGEQWKTAVVVENKPGRAARSAARRWRRRRPTATRSSCRRAPS